VLFPAVEIAALRRCAEALRASHPNWRYYHDQDEIRQALAALDAAQGRGE